MSKSTLGACPSRKGYIHHSFKEHTVCEWFPELVVLPPQRLTEAIGSSARISLDALAYMLSVSSPITRPKVNPRKRPYIRGA